MTDNLIPDEIARLKLADPEDLRVSVAYGLQFNRRKRIHHADSDMANIAAVHLLKHLEASGYVILQKLPPPRHSAPDYAAKFRNS